MKLFNLNFFLFTINVFLAFTNRLSGQVPDFSKVPGLHEGDSANITYLIRQGIKIEDRKVICWFPKDSLTADTMKEIAATLNKGINGAENFIGAPLSWQLHPTDEPYTFYFRFDRLISHASQAGFVSIPFWRLKEGKSPWLHEVLHEMLDTKTGSWSDTAISEKEWSENMPLWLFEGLPDYISTSVSMSENLPRFDVFANSSMTNTDNLFKEELKADTGSYILSFIGTKGVLPELFSKERMHYAPAFYHGSASFVKYIAEHYGLKILLTGISTFRKEQETIVKLTGKSIQALKDEWMDQLKIQK